MTIQFNSCAETWQPDPIVMLERDNSIQVSLPERDNPIPNHTPESQTQVYHQDHTIRVDSWHTIIQLSSFTIRVINNATSAYMYAL